MLSGIIQKCFHLLSLKVSLNPILSILRSLRLEEGLFNLSLFFIQVLTKTLESPKTISFGLSRKQSVEICPKVY